MPKDNTPRHQVALADDITASGGRLRTKSITGKRKSRSEEDGRGDGYIDAQSSRKILAIAQDLAEEDAEERRVTAKVVAPNSAFDITSRIAENEDEDETLYHDEEEDWLPEEEVVGEDVDPDDLAVYSKFLPEGNEMVDFVPSLAKLSTNGVQEGTDSGQTQKEEGESVNLADLILQRIAEKEALDASRAQRQAQGVDHLSDPAEIPPKVVETFQKCGMLLSRYKSGPLPKPLKVLPSLPQWPELLAITRPESWTPNAVYAANRVFKSSNVATAQHFNETILLDRVREDIYENKKLNVHLYNALKDSLYKPAAFFKGILFPLVQSSCTLREAHIISSVVARKRVPALHCAAALLRLCEISAEQSSSVNSESAGAANVFIRVILEKKYALPYKAVDALVFHFLRFRTTIASVGKDVTTTHKQDTRLPVLWHQCFLVFAQHYKKDITEDQREALLDLLLARGHREIGPEIRRELLEGRGSGREVADSGGVNGAAREDGDDTMDVT